MMLYNNYKVKIVEKRAKDEIGSPSNEERLNNALAAINREARENGCSLSVDIIPDKDEYVILYMMPSA